MKVNKEYQIRYVIYAAYHSRTPDEQMLYDKEKSNGGAIMMEFSLWIQKKWKQYAKVADVNLDYLLPNDHENFNVWLAKQRKSKRGIIRQG